MKPRQLATRKKPSAAQYAGLDFVEFEDNGRKLTARRASSPATPDTTWWWLEVTGESQKYAAFRAEAGDTEQNLRPRFVAFYEKLLADRARPREIPKRWSRPAPAAPAAPAADQEPT